MATPIPSNRAEFTAERVARATQAETCGSQDTSCCGVVTDSRADVAGKLFVALAGERFDGHRYVADVLARGAWGAIVERDLPGLDPSKVFRVDSALKALGALAKAHRATWGKQVVTVAGSAGKTTTRSAISAMLSALAPGKIHSTQGNLNNLVGVPLTLLGLEAGHEIAVVEVGTNQRGEVASLSAICEANIAVLTCIGLEHSAGLGDLDGVEAEESQIFSGLCAPCTAVGGYDDPRVRRLLTALSGTTKLSYGVAEGATHRVVERVSRDLSRTRLRICRSLNGQQDEVELTTRLLGLPGALASAAALAVADALYGRVTSAQVNAALDGDVGEGGRLHAFERSDRALIIDDCYNANPLSMRSSIAVAKDLAASRGSRLCLVLGDMLELGDLSEREHAALVGEVSGTDHVVLVGEEMRALAHAAQESGRVVQHFTTAIDACARVRSAISACDVVLVKGSRSMKLEAVVRALAGEEGKSP